MKSHYSLILIVSLCVYSSVFSQSLSYSIDTIFKSYSTELTDRTKGAPDLHITDSFFTMILNYCGPGELAVLDHHSDTFRKLLTFTGDCRDIYTKYTPEGIYMLNQDGYLLHYTETSRQGKIVANLLKDSLLYTLGLDIEQSKTMSNMHVNVSESTFYFRLMQSFENPRGTYGYKRIRQGAPLFCKYDLKDKTMAFFGHQYHTNRRFGFLNKFFDLYIGDSIFISEAVSGKVTVINTLTNVTSITEVRSAYDTVPIIPYKSPHKFKKRLPAKIAHGNATAEYEALYYNPYTDYYYRIFHPAPALNAENGQPKEKESVLMILDQRFRLVDEYLLPFRQTGRVLLPTENGVDMHCPDLYDFTKTYSTYAYLRITHSPVK